MKEETWHVTARTPTGKKHTYDIGLKTMPSPKQIQRHLFPGDEALCFFHQIPLCADCLRPKKKCECDKS